MKASPSQQAAITCDENAIIFAGPGSGKTATSVQKALRILSNPNRSLLMCTFTRDSAQEMQHRLEKAMTEAGLPLPAPHRLRVSTLDSLCLWHYKSTIGDKFKLLNPASQYPKLRGICKEFGLGNLDEHQQLFDAYQSTRDRTQLIEKLENESPNTLVLINEYYAFLKACNMLDLATIKRTVALGLYEGTVPLFPFTDMIVDETQDSDELQLLIAIVHGQNDVVTTLVGDDDQTIYDWRAACGYQGMIRFVQECKAQVVRLGENYRSRAEVVFHASNLIRYNNPNRVEKNQVAIRGAGGFVGGCHQDDPETEAEWIAGHIAENHTAPYNVAVLSRTNILLDIAEAALQAAGIPCYRAGTSLWERDDIAAYLSMLLFMCKGSADLLSPSLGLLGFKSQSVNAIMQELSSHHIKFRRGHGVEIDGLESIESQVINQMSKCMGKWRNDAKEGEIDLVIYESSHEFSRWYSMLGAVAKKSGSEHPQVTRLKRGLTSVEKALTRIRGDLKGRVRLLTRKKKEEPEEGVVRLMTMHGSKGLEWDHVYMIGCDETDDHSSVTLGPSERRVFFVGMTRARESLWMTYGGKTPLFLLEAKVENLLSSPKPFGAAANAGEEDPTLWDDEEQEVEA
ncbi:ATP-dependent helicase [Comamonas sp. w2-DMI]|uniref:ATP-dependent helicase n=1 Tax=Comamonas sp. w2-DMI TaxID=3126391 RepID=UPI0032E4F8B5